MYTLACYSDVLDNGSHLQFQLIPSSSSIYLMARLCHEALLLKTLVAVPSSPKSILTGKEWIFWNSSRSCTHPKHF